jgi:DNA-binding CsgD family transcriptional regulator
MIGQSERNLQKGRNRNSGFLGLFEKRGSLVFLGLTCPQVWLTFMFESLAPTAPLSVEVFYMTRGLTLLIIAAVLILTKTPRSDSLPFLSWPLAIVMSAAPYLAIIPFPVFDTQIALLGAVLGGAGLVVCYLQCIFVYSRLDVKRIAAYVLVSFSLASLIRFPLELIPLEFSILLVTPLPFVCILMCRKARSLIEQTFEEKAIENTQKTTKLIPVAVELAIYGIVVGMVRLSAEGAQYEIVIIGAHLAFRLAFPLVILWLLFKQDRQVNISLLCQLSLLFIITALITISLFGGATSQVAVIVSTCTRTVIIILLWFVLALLSSRSNQHPYFIFCIGWALYMLSIACGMVITGVFHLHEEFSASFFMNLIYFLVVTTILILSMKNDANRQQLLQETRPRSLQQDSKSIDDQCKVLGEQCGLTKREIEVMGYICKGRSKIYIAKTLVISENTVRGYAKNIYSKLKIHNRQELLDLLDSL